MPTYMEIICQSCSACRLRVVACSRYEGVKAAPLDTPPLNTSVGVQQQQQEVLRLSAVLEAIDALARGAVPFNDDLVQAAKGSSTQTVQRPSDQISASEADELQVGSRACVHLSNYNPAPLCWLQRQTCPGRVMRRPRRTRGQWWGTTAYSAPRGLYYSFIHACAPA